jgi:zinc transporter 9
LAAPVGAIGTYLILKLILGGDAEEGLSFYTGITLVFSGGTFLFVATSHVTNGKTDGANEEVDERNKIGKLSRLGMVLAGMITPGILSKLVGHGH